MMGLGFVWSVGTTVLSVILRMGAFSVGLVWGGII